MMKGVILSLNSSAGIVDICHQIPAHSIKQAAYQWKASYSYFPPGTVHVGVVDPGVGGKRKGILAVSERYFYIAPDNGLLSLIEQADPFKAVYELANPDFQLADISHTFHGRDIFAPAAAHLTLGASPLEFGPPVKEIRRLEFPEPRVTGDRIEGEIIGSDRFGNLFTNIDGSLFFRHFQGTDFVLSIRDKTVTTFREYYAQRESPEAFVLINSRGQLEIAFTNDRADRRLGVGAGDIFVIQPTSRTEF